LRHQLYRLSGNQKMLALGAQHMAMSLQTALLWLAAVNVTAFAAFGLDKKLAQNGSRRISENTLLWLALVGGSIGAVGGQQLFRHKTRKEPFRSLLYGIVVLQTVGISIWLVRPNVFSVLQG
jgi:uncharacterized membrane protein YsdA (DUF1294 family)